MGIPMLNVQNDTFIIGDGVSASNLNRIGDKI